MTEMRTTTRITGAVAIALLAAGITACGTTTATHTPAPPAATASQPAAVPQAGTGATFTVKTTHAFGGDWYTMAITLDKVTEPAPPDPETDTGFGNLSAARPGHHLAAAAFTYTTMYADDGQAHNPSSLVEFTAKGSDGHRYTPGLGGAGDGIDNQQPAKGETASGTVSFEVPDGTHLTAVTFEPLGGEPVTWQLGK